MRTHGHIISRRASRFASNMFDIIVCTSHARSRINALCGHRARAHLVRYLLSICAHRSAFMFSGASIFCVMVWTWTHSTSTFGISGSRIFRHRFRHQTVIERRAPGASSKTLTRIEHIASTFHTRARITLVFLFCVPLLSRDLYTPLIIVA